MQLLEREQPMALLGALAREATARKGRIALISGEAGIGKTSLLRRFCADAELPSFWGVCDFLSTPQPLGPWNDLLPQIGADTNVEASRRLFFNDVLKTLAREPAIIVIEDIHWADAASLDLLKFIGRRLHRVPVLLVLTYRADERTARTDIPLLLADLPSELTRRVALGPLSQSAVAALTASPADAARLHAISGGNPFFLTEILAAGTATVPATITDAVLHRKARLSESARVAVEALSVHPGHVAWRLLEPLNVDPAAVDEASASGFLRVEKNQISFRHEIARLAVESSLLPARAAELHRHALTVLTAEPGVSKTRLVHHARRAGDPVAVVDLAPQAADEAARVGAHRESLSLYQIALDEGSSMSAEARALLSERIAYEAYLIQEINRSLAARREALAVWRAAGDLEKIGENLRWCSRLSWFLAQKRDAERYALEAIATLEQLPPGRQLAWAYSNLAQLRMLEQNLEETNRWAKPAVEIARSLDDPEILSHALNNIGTVGAHAGDKEGMGQLAEALRIALEHELHEHAARAYTNLVSSAVHRREYAEAAEWLRRGIEYCEQRDLDSWVRYKLGWRATMRLARDDWTGASEDAAKILLDVGSSAITRIMPFVVVATVRLRRGDPGWREPLDEATALARGSEELQRLGPVALARAEAIWLHGDPESTNPELEQAWNLAQHVDDVYIREDLRWWRTCEGFAERAAKLEQLGCRYEAAMALAHSAEAADLVRALELVEHLPAVPLKELVRRRLAELGARIPRGPRRSTRGNAAGLTERQMDVLQLVAEGLRNEEIAARLFVSTKTVDHHVSAVLQKLGARSRAEAGHIARARGLLSTRET